MKFSLTIFGAKFKTARDKKNILAGKFKQLENSKNMYMYNSAGKFWRENSDNYNNQHKSSIILARKFKYFHNNCKIQFDSQFDAKIQTL